MSYVKIVTFVPIGAADKVRQAMGDAGAGNIGDYSYCSFSCRGHGRFTPGDGSNPHIGTQGKPEVVVEERIEVIADRDVAKKVIAALRQAHPYEGVALDIIPLLSEDEL